MTATWAVSPYMCNTLSSANKWFMHHFQSTVPSKLPHSCVLSYANAWVTSPKSDGTPDPGEMILHHEEQTRQLLVGPGCTQKTAAMWQVPHGQARGWWWQVSALQYHHRPFILFWVIIPNIRFMTTECWPVDHLLVVQLHVYCIPNIGKKYNTWDQKSRQDAFDSPLSSVILQSVWKAHCTWVHY